MKKRILVTCLGMCLIFCACGTQKETEDKVEIKPKIQNQSPDKEVEQITEEVPTIEYMDYSEDIKEEESGVPLLNVQENCPVIYVKDNEPATLEMNKVFEQQHTSNQLAIKADLEYAQDAYNNSTEQEIAVWRGYDFEYMYETAYCSEKIISFKAASFDRLGAPDLGIWTSAYSFDGETGKLLRLADVFTDLKAGKKIVEQYIAEKVTSNEYRNYLLEDYESYISDVLTEDVFYLQENGLVVVCNPDLLTQYAVGVIEIEIPYSELAEVMNEAYLPAQ